MLLQVEIGFQENCLILFSCHINSKVTLRPIVQIVGEKKIIYNIITKIQF